MAGTPKSVQVPPPGGGLNIATIEYPRPDGSLVELQVIVHGDPNNPSALSAVVNAPPAGIEFGTVAWLAYSAQLQEQSDLLRRLLDALNTLIALQGGIPAQ
jgi:hypothetical protein